MAAPGQLLGHRKTQLSLECATQSEELAVAAKQSVESRKMAVAAKQSVECRKLCEVHCAAKGGKPETTKPGQQTGVDVYTQQTETAKHGFEDLLQLEVCLPVSTQRSEMISKITRFKIVPVMLNKEERK